MKEDIIATNLSSLRSGIQALPKIIAKELKRDTFLQKHHRKHNDLKKLMTEK